VFLCPWLVVVVCVYALRINGLSIYHDYPNAAYLQCLHSVSAIIKAIGPRQSQFSGSRGLFCEWRDTHSRVLLITIYSGNHTLSRILASRVNGARVMFLLVRLCGGPNRSYVSVNQPVFNFLTIVAGCKCTLLSQLLALLLFFFTCFHFSLDL
jgi:hypothetical protein